MIFFLQLKEKKMMEINLLNNHLKIKHLLAVVNRIQKKLRTNSQIKVKNTLKFLTNTSKIFRKT